MASQGNRVVSCPACGKPVEWDASQRWRPFCSERCKLVDLGDWLDESNHIAGEPGGEPLGSPDDPA